MAPTTQWQPTKRMYGGITLGTAVRGQIGRGPLPVPPLKTGIVIFRVRRGNGYYGAVLGKSYQDKYNYFVPLSINNTQGQAARNALAAAVLNWQTILTVEQKAAYSKRASKGLRMSGYNLYISEYVRANA